jgi:hypothetical protein
MKLAAIYNVWDGEELLKGSVDCVKDHVEAIIIVYQETSNYGEVYCPVFPEFNLKKIYFVKYIPGPGNGRHNEARKRNLGIAVAKGLKCTHFLHMDCDEYYSDFEVGKRCYIDSGSEGSVCKMWTYFKKPTLRFEQPDNYYVPFIHRLSTQTTSGFRGYPFYVDPTRAVNTCDVKEMPIYMNHFSWVRSNIDRKVHNSSARGNILASDLLRDYRSPDTGPGSYIKDFGQKLIEVPNQFSINIPHLMEVSS